MNPTAGRPRLGILATHAIQYQTPLYQELSRRDVVDLHVAFLSADGVRPYHDVGFGITVSWDVNLLDGYRWTLLELDSLRTSRWLLALTAWLRRQDIIVLHGHADPRMLFAAAACRVSRLPYLLRGDSHPESTAVGLRRLGRHMLASLTVGGAAGALPVGELNAAFYERYGHIPQFRAPHSVDNNRFRYMADAAQYGRAARLASLGLDPDKPVVIFSGKLSQRKRPLDAVRAIERCGGKLSLLLLGDGPLREVIRPFETRLPVRCLGFVNQVDLPGWYACGDVLVLPSEREPWGLVVNEGMASGLVPVVSDAVGCAADLVEGIGEVVAIGDIDGLSRALLRASQDSRSRSKILQKRLERFTIAETAHGYEEAALVLARKSRG